MSVASLAKGPRLPKASLRSCPRPLTEAEFCIQVRNASRVFGSSAAKISSIWVGSGRVGKLAAVGEGGAAWRPCCRR